jgi:hypothetical protein
VQRMLKVGVRGCPFEEEFPVRVGFEWWVVGAPDHDGGIWALARSLAFRGPPKKSGW